MSEKVSERTVTTTTTGAYLHIVIPDGLGGWLSRKIAFSDVVTACQADNAEVGTFDNGDLVDSVWSYEHLKGTVYVDLLLYDGNGVRQSVDSLLTVDDSNNISINFGGAITGTWIYIFLYWSA